MSISESVTGSARRHRGGAWSFYLAMAWLAGLIAVVGFSRRYIGPVATGTSDLPAIVHIHGAFAFGWIAFFILQTSLAASHRIALHRSLGLAGIALGTLVAFTATEVAVLLIAREAHGGGPPHATEFAADLLSWALLFSALFGASIAYVDRPETHKRLMLLATFVVLAAAFARIIQLLDSDLSRLARNDLASLPVDGLVLWALLRDWRQRKRPHQALVWGAAGVVSVQALTLLLRGTAAWAAATSWLASWAAA